MSENRKSKPEVVTFKADEALLEAMKGIPNRSEFIRSAVLAALDGTCPLCGGTGTLTVNQRRHLSELKQDHTIQECDDCHEMYIVCARQGHNDTA